MVAKVTIHLHATLQRQTPEGLVRRLTTELPDGETLGALLARLGFPADDEHIILVVGGRMADPAQVLHDGDEIHLIPPISGGAPIASR